MQEVLMIETVPSGTVLHGRYRIERVLGSGGFGHVYLAVDMVSNQQCAVKEYLVTGTSGQEQLKHEATVLSHLHHPSLPAFQDAFIERGRYYVVLNYIEGNDLTDLIRVVRQRNEMIPITKTLNWLIAVCDAVTFLHNQQPIVIHRDIKPDNIRITPAGTAVLVDLGNAKAAADGARTLFFIRHQGTPGYAPPEQYPGGSGTDARSDVYALGATLYFALTTHEPPSVSVRNQSIQQGTPTLPSLQDHLLNNPPEESPEAIAARQFRLGVTKPSKPVPRHSRHIAQLGLLPPMLLSQLNMIIQKSMALKPKERYQYVADFASDLRQIALALSNSPTPPTPPKRSVDPHSTQPDLPGLYDALQEAKDQAGQSSGDSSPGTQPMLPPNASNITCPRCGKSLAPRAVFCPHCGTALSSKTTPPQPAQQAPSAHNKDITSEETQVINPKMMQEAVAAYNAGRAQGVISSTPNNFPQPPQPQPWVPIQSNGRQAQTKISPAKAGQSAQNYGLQQPPQIQQNSTTMQTTSDTGLSTKAFLLIAGIIGVVVILAIILFLILK
jgi:serine/threonine protein kinase